MAENDRVVLIGTYKKGQLAKWRGWYNYPMASRPIFVSYKTCSEIPKVQGGLS